MPEYRVEIMRTVANEITVEADSPEEAQRIADRRDTVIPSLEDGQTLDGWEYVVYDPTTQEELYRA